MERKILKRVLLIAVGISVLYIVTSCVLIVTELKFREWVDACGIILTGFVIPILVYLVFRKEKDKEIIKTKGIVIHLGELICFGIWTYVIYVFLIFNIDEERRVTKSLLIANEAEFLQENDYELYEPIAFFFKKSCRVTPEKKQEYLEKKYGKKVMEQYADIQVDTYMADMKLHDNLVEEVTIKHGIQALQDLKIDRDYFVGEVYIRDRDLCIELRGQEDIPDFSKDVCEIFDYINNKTDFFRKNKGTFYYYSGEGDSRITGSVHFGSLSHYDIKSDKYYLKLEEVERDILESYLFGVTNLENRKAYEEEMNQMLLDIQEQAKEEEPETGSQLQEETSEEVMEKEGFFGEEAARKVYEECLAKEGYTFEVKYNAKGNLYIELESRPAGEPEDKSMTGFYEVDLVYDGLSKNGNCEIFVLQRSHYSEDYMEQSTVILDMYAVETTTGQVVVGNKQSWGALGTEEYRAITGE